MRGADHDGANPLLGQARQPGLVLLEQPDPHATISARLQPPVRDDRHGGIGRARDRRATAPGRADDEPVHGPTGPRQHPRAVRRREAGEDVAAVLAGAVAVEGRHRVEVTGLERTDTAAGSATGTVAHP